MPFLFHSIIFLSYASMAAAVAMVAPETVPGVDQNLALVIGGVVLVGCGLLHEVFARFEWRRTNFEQVTALRHAQDRVMEELSRARGETRRIYEALEGVGRAGGSGPDIKEVMAEVKVLENLVKRLSDEGERERRPAPAKEITVGKKADKRAPAPKVASGLDDAAILDLVRDALNDGRVDLFLQPVVSLPQRKHQYYECFSRIRVDADSILVPEQYLGIAENEGLITAIDNMLLFRCIQLVRRTQKGRRTFGFFCNISPRSLADKPFLREFVDFMGLNTELAGNLVFEFAQSALDTIDEEIRRELNRLASYGFRFSVDRVTNLDLDFEELARERVKFIKIDAGILLSQIPQGGPTSGLRELKRRFDRVGIDLIAEKIENEQMLVELLDFPIDFGQGYLFGEPRLSRDNA